MIVSIQFLLSHANSSSNMLLIELHAKIQKIWSLQVMVAFISVPSIKVIHFLWPTCLNGHDYVMV